MVSIQSNMQVHDDLAALFSRNMTFNADLRPESVPKQMPEADMMMTTTMTEPNNHHHQSMAYSVSQHYHHSRAPAQSEFQRASSEPSHEMTPSDVLLRIHGIDPATLTPSQLQLFRVADTPQRRRLVELWSICPPSAGADIPALAWSSTTVEHEEQLALLRYERRRQSGGQQQHQQQQQQQQQQSHAMSLDGTMVQTTDSRWALQAHAAESEPYMLSGYQELMRRERERQQQQHQASHAYTPSNDPVYQGPDYARQMQMAQQYGSFEQSRELDVMDM